MGLDGLRRATLTAIAAANYVAARLGEHYPVLYAGAGGRVAHECILDLRKITKESGVTVDDVAKRLADYGLHAPTMSFPVAGTLMVEPTESEDLAEIDRFVDAMIGIRGEIARVAAGEWPVEDNPLRGAPHTAACIADKWDHPYSRELAAYPKGLKPGVHDRKVWPPVRRVDGAHGDRNLVCSCPPVARVRRSGVALARLRPGGWDPSCPPARIRTSRAEAPEIPGGHIRRVRVPTPPAVDVRACHRASSSSSHSAINRRRSGAAPAAESAWARAYSARPAAVSIRTGG